MTTPVKYNKPRRINVVSIVLVALLAMGAYATYLYLPLYLTKHEAYRVLEETSSKIAGRAGLYAEDSSARDEVRLTMQRQIKGLGVDDPNIETWIEFEGKEVHLGVVYSTWVEWPFGIAERQESIYELEHTIIVN
ncbi:MAG: hypothetical protein AB1Z98_30415 [Nannocystaceae bacterium]